MHSAFFYISAIAALMVASGSVITVVALRNAPEGYEGEDGFVGLTKGDERLLNEFAAFKQQAMQQMGGGQMAA